MKFQFKLNSGLSQSLDPDADASEVSIRVNVAASSGGGGSIGLDDISSMSEDSVAIIAMGVVG